MDMHKYSPCWGPQNHIRLTLYALQSSVVSIINCKVCYMVSLFLPVGYMTKNKDVVCILMYDTMLLLPKESSYFCIPVNFQWAYELHYLRSLHKAAYTLISFCQFSEWQLLISCIFGSNWTLYFGWKFLLLFLLPSILLNWQKLTVTNQCVRGLTSDGIHICSIFILLLWSY